MKRALISSWDELFMRHAYLIALKSKDPRTKIGAVLVKNKTIFSEGYNGFPRGVVDSNERYDDRNVKLAFVAHAELNAIVNAARLGVSTLDSTMYTQCVPCSEICAKAIINAGVKDVVVHTRWRWPESDLWDKSMEISMQMFREAGVVVAHFEGFLNVNAYSNGKIITV